MPDESRTLRAIFDEDAALYDAARPGYPAALFDDVATLAALPPATRILEIGCGTGQATVSWAQHGYKVDCVELGANMAALASRTLASYPQVQVHVGAFEEWPVVAGAYDLVTAATAFHWIDPAVRYRKAADALRPGGGLAVFSNKHVHSDAGGDFFARAQALYERITPEIAEPGAEKLLRPADVPEDERSNIEASGLFEPVTVRRYVWNQPYSAESYIRVLNTYSGHRALAAERRSQLLNSIAALINGDFGGQIVKGYLTLLYVARKR